MSNTTLEMGNKIKMPMITISIQDPKASVCAVPGSGGEDGREKSRKAGGLLKPRPCSIRLCLDFWSWDRYHPALSPPHPSQPMARFKGCVLIAYCKRIRKCHATAPQLDFSFEEIPFISQQGFHNE